MKNWGLILPRVFPDFVNELSNLYNSEQAQAERLSGITLPWKGVPDCHSGSLEKYYEFTNSYFSCYSESINTY